MIAHTKDLRRHEINKLNSVEEREMEMEFQVLTDSEIYVFTKILIDKNSFLFSSL